MKKKYGDAGARIVMIYTIDITDRKRAEKALKNNQNFLNRIIDQSPFATWVA